MAVLIPMLFEIDGDVVDPVNTPAFRDSKGKSLTPKKVHRFIGSVV